MALLQPKERIWKQLNDTSHGFRLTEKEIVLNFCRNMRYVLGTMAWERKNKKPSSLMLGEIHSYIYQYDTNAKNGLFIEVTDSAE